MTRVEVDGYDIVGIRAGNPGPFTLSGTNSWIIGRRPAWLIDPGPDLASHRQALLAEIDRRGGLGGILLTHDHPDHAEGVSALHAAHPSVALGAARGDVDRLLRDGDSIGPVRVMALPGHAPDHLVFQAGDAVFSGDAVLGEGSVFIAPDPGALTGYLAGLDRLRQRNPAVLLPGHGPVVDRPRERIDEYIAHRLERERRLIAAIERDARRIDELLDGAWGEVPPELRPAATVTLAAHLDKLALEGRLPADVERPGAG